MNTLRNNPYTRISAGLVGGAALVATYFWLNSGIEGDGLEAQKHVNTALSQEVAHVEAQFAGVQGVRTQITADSSISSIHRYQDNVDYSVTFTTGKSEVLDITNPGNIHRIDLIGKDVDIVFTNTGGESSPHWQGTYINGAKTLDTQTPQTAASNADFMVGEANNVLLQGFGL